MWSNERAEQGAPDLEGTACDDNQQSRIPLAARDRRNTRGFIDSHRLVALVLLCLLRQRSFEPANAFPQSSPELRQLLWTEHQQRNRKDQEQMHGLQ